VKRLGAGARLSRLTVLVGLAACRTSLPTPSNPATTSVASEKTMAFEQESLRILNTYLSLVVRARPDDFRPVPKAGPALVDRALFGSLTWCGRVFRVPVNDPGDSIKHTFHVATAASKIDLLLHEPIVDGMPLRVYESSSFFAVFVPAAALSAVDAAGKAGQAAQLLLTVNPVPAFKPITIDPNHRSYSTDPEHPVLGVGDWTLRVDAAVVGPDLVLVLYKATYDDQMTQVTDPGNWFNELRQVK
jgi:hypothetical protein